MSVMVNRAETLYRNWEEKLKELETMADLKPERKGLMKLKYNFLREGLFRISAAPQEKEKLHLFVIQAVMLGLQKQLYPNRFLRLYHQLKGMVWDRPRHLRKFQAKRLENIAALTTLMKSSGMAGLSGKLEKTLDFESKELSISGMELMADQGKLMVTLQLDKQGLGNYKAQEYLMVWNTQDEQVRSCRIPVDSGIALSEAFNMLQGRAVCKAFENVEGKMIRQWVQLDVQAARTEKPIVAFLPDQGFDLKKALQETGVHLECYGLLKEQTLKLLESGHQVGFQLRGKEDFKLQANPGNKGLDFFGRDGSAITLESLKNSKQEPVRDWAKELSLVRHEHVDQFVDKYIYR